MKYKYLWAGFVEMTFEAKYSFFCFTMAQFDKEKNIMETLLRFLSLLRDDFTQPQPSR